MKCMNCGAPVDDLSYYCWDCKYGLKDEINISTQGQDATHVSENVQREMTQVAYPEFPGNKYGEAKEDLFHSAFPKENLIDLHDRLRTARGILIGDFVGLILPSRWDERIKINQVITDMKRYLYIRKVYQFRKKDF